MTTPINNKLIAGIAASVTRSTVRRTVEMRNRAWWLTRSVKSHLANARDRAMNLGSRGHFIGEDKKSVRTAHYLPPTAHCAHLSRRFRLSFAVEQSPQPLQLGLIRDCRDVLDDALLFPRCEPPAQRRAGAVLPQAIEFGEDTGIGCSFVLEVDAVDRAVEPRVGVADEVVVGDVLEVLEVIVNTADRLRDAVDNRLGFPFLDVDALG